MSELTERMGRAAREAMGIETLSTHGAIDDAGRFPDGRIELIDDKYGDDPVHGVQRKAGTIIFRWRISVMDEEGKEKLIRSTELSAWLGGERAPLTSEPDPEPIVASPVSPPTAYFTPRSDPIAPALEKIKTPAPTDIKKSDPVVFALPRISVPQSEDMRVRQRQEAEKK